MRIPHVLARSAVIVPLVAITAPAAAGDSRDRVQFLPGHLLFAPPVANYQEPRVGLRKQIGSSRMKLDIGVTIDFLHIAADSAGAARFGAGADFFTYALTTSAQGLRLQVDAADGFFGGHIAVARRTGNAEWSARLRILHLSAHFLDGHYDPVAHSWKDGRDPIPFTKDFGEVLGRYSCSPGPVSFDVYAGLAYATLVRPASLRRISLLSGMELRLPSFPGSVLDKPASAFAACHVSVIGVPVFVGTSNVEAGLKLGDWDGQGIRIYASYYSGLSIFSEYYNVRDDEWGLGFTFDLW